MGIKEEDHLKKPKKLQKRQKRVKRGQKRVKSGKKQSKSNVFTPTIQPMREWKKIKRRKIKVDNLKNQVNRKIIRVKQEKIRGKKKQHGC